MKKWFVRLYLPAMVLILTVGMLFVLKFGYTKTPPVVIKPSNFESPTAMGEIVFRRFYSQIKDAKLIAFGIPPQPAWHKDILTGFLKSAKKEGIPFEVLIAENQMPELDMTGLEDVQVVRLPTNSQTQSELVDTINQSAGKMILLYLPSVFSTHVLSASPIFRLEAALGHKVMSFTTSPVAFSQDQEYLIDPPCLGTERDSNGTSQLGCAILHAARGFYRKKPSQDTWAAMMNQPSPHDDYLLMVSSPGQDKNNREANERMRMSPPQDRGEAQYPTGK